MSSVKKQLGEVREWALKIADEVKVIEDRSSKLNQVSVNKEINHQIAVVEGHINRVKKLIKRGNIEKIRKEILSVKGQFKRLDNLLEEFEHEFNLNNNKRSDCDRLIKEVAKIFKNEFSLDDKEENEDIKIKPSKLDKVLKEEVNLMEVLENNEYSQKELDLIWNKLLDEIKKEISLPSFETWFKPTILISKSDNNMVIKATNEFAEDWLEQKYKKLLVAKAYEVFEEEYNFYFVCDYNE